MKQGVVKNSALLLLVTVSFLVVGTNSQQCPQPSQSEISTSLRTYLVSTGGESSTITVNLQNYQFTCQAVAASNMYRSLSVAVQYTTTDSGVTSAVQYAQFQLECVTGSPNHYQLPSSAPFEADVSPSLLTTPTRRDCQFCTGLSTGPAGLNTTANCLSCSSTCLGVGQGACAAGGTTCCPFFNTDGSCTTACPTNYTASSDTNYNCSECAIPCSLGHEPNPACDGCVPVHICFTKNPCQNGATCNIVSNTDYTCSCPPNYSGQDCDQCVLPCPLGYAPNSACTECVPVHICVTSNPCQNGATCNIGTNSNTDYTCSCLSLFTDTNCSTRSPCASRPCQNGGNCSSSAGVGYSCACSNSWRGTNCTECGVDNCVQCSQSREGCEMCDRGYSLDDDQCSLLPTPGSPPLGLLGLIIIPIIIAAIFITIAIICIVIYWNNHNRVHVDTV